MSFFSHLKETENPQSYYDHWKVAFFGSLKLIGAGIAGLIHSFVPPLFPFFTSTRVIQVFKILVDTRRHKDEIEDVFGAEIYQMWPETKPDKGKYIKFDG